ncbi:MAG: hypothetical protein ACJA1R_002795 [Flavobacteriales bacterium]|jgi:hypothetical protein
MNYLRRKHLELSRRRFLRGMMHGTAAALALPFFEMSVGATGRAMAMGDGFPKRFGLFFWGNGVLPERWVPSIMDGEGNWTLSEQLEGLASIKDSLAVITGTEVKVENIEPHHSGAAGILSGVPLDFRPSGDWNLAGPSIDQIIAGEIGRDTRFRSVEFGAKPAGGYSTTESLATNPPEQNPWALYNRIFGGDFREPGDTSEPDPRLLLRRSVLDGVASDINAFERELGATDRARLDQHLTSVRELELRLERLAEDPITLAACTRPGQPLPEYPDLDGRPQLAAANRAMCDVMALAFACDQTRVFSNFITHPVNNLLLGDATSGHHQLTHDEPGDQPQVNAITKLLMEEYKYLVEALRGIPEGDGTVLDNCAILGTSDISYGRNHGLDEFPLLIAGSAGGRLKQNVHYRSETKQNAGDVILTLMRSLDMLAPSYGAGSALAERGFADLEA